MTSPASDAAVLQTATSLVVLAASTYQSLQTSPALAAATGPGGGGASGLGPGGTALVRDHVADALAALSGARSALGEATRTAGARVQQAPDPVLAPVVTAALATVRTPGDAVGVALVVEDALAQTLVADVSLATAPAVRGLAASLGTAAAGRQARLLVVSSLLAAGAGPLVVAPPDLTRLPASTGTVGFPDARFPTVKASPPTEGAL